MRQPSRPDTLFLASIEGPIGTMLLIHDSEERLNALDFHDYEARMRQLLMLQYGTQVALRRSSAPTAIAHAMAQYFAGDLAAIDQIPVASAGTTFQQEVWSALRAIPAGTTLSYGTLAQRLGRPKAFRAVGRANGANPISIVVPCHRLIGSDGSPTGYGGGIERKRWLLTHEGASFMPGR